MSKKVVRKVEGLAEELAKAWGVSPRIAAGRALEDALARERKRKRRRPKGANAVKEGEVMVTAEELFEEMGPFQVRQLVKFMWGDGVEVVGGRAVADVVTKALRANGWVRKRVMRNGAILYVWLRG